MNNNGKQIVDVQLMHSISLVSLIEVIMVMAGNEVRNLCEDAIYIINEGPYFKRRSWML